MITLFLNDEKTIDDKLTTQKKRESISNIYLLNSKHKVFVPGDFPSPPLSAPPKQTFLKRKF